MYFHRPISLASAESLERFFRPTLAHYPKKQITYSRLVGEAIVHAGSLASVIDDSVFPTVSPALAIPRGLSHLSLSLDIVT